MSEYVEMSKLTSDQRQIIRDIVSHIESLIKLTSCGTANVWRQKSIFKSFAMDLAKFEDEILYFSDARFYYCAISIIGFFMIRFDKVDHAILQLIKLFTISYQKNDEVKKQQELHLFYNLMRNYPDKFEIIYNILMHTQPNRYQGQFKNSWAKLDKIWH